MQKNRVISVVLILCILCTLMQHFRVKMVHAQDAEDFIYEIIDGEVKITGYTGDITGDLIIPDYIEEYPVTVIGESVFNYGTENDPFLGGNLKLPVYLKRIENSAFYGCKFFGELKLPYGLEYIGEYAFANCIFFSGDLIIPDSVTDVMAGAFNGDSGFRGKLKLSNNMTIIHENTFYGCREFTGVLTLPDGLKGIKNSAFALGYKIKGPVVIPDSVYYIEEQAFSACTSIHAMYVPDTVAAIGSAALAIGGDGNTIYTPEGSLAYQIVMSEDDGSVSCTKCKVANSPEEMMQILYPTPKPTKEPTSEPTAEPTSEPTAEPTSEPTAEPTSEPTVEPTSEPTAEPTLQPTAVPTVTPILDSTPSPTLIPTLVPTLTPTSVPTATPQKGKNTLETPVFSLKKKVSSNKQKYILIKLKKYAGKYVEVYVKVDKRKYVKLKLANNKISKVKKSLKFSYSFSKHTLYFKLRTYKKIGKKKIYSKKSKEKRIRV